MGANFEKLRKRDHFSWCNPQNCTWLMSIILWLCWCAVLTHISVSTKSTLPGSERRIAATATAPLACGNSNTKKGGLIHTNTVQKVYIQFQYYPIYDLVVSKSSFFQAYLGWRSWFTIFFGVDIPRGPIRNTEILATCLAFSSAIFLFVETWWFSHFLFGKPGKRISPLLYWNFVGKWTSSILLNFHRLLFSKCCCKVNESKYRKNPQNSSHFFWCHNAVMSN
jgi:hypothetical protein